jgi:hypothetical protein
MFQRQEDSCDYEKATLCAFDSESTADQVAFLACMDTSEEKALAAATSCAEAGNVSATDIEKCFNSDKAETLLAAASVAWNKAYPGRAYVPTVQVNGKEVCGGTGGASATAATIDKAICAAGSTASVCQSKYVMCLA